jgi:hypothetical protein
MAVFPTSLSVRWGKWLLVVLVVLSGCVHRSNSPALTGAGVADDVKMTLARQSRVERLRQEALAKCMKRKGFPYRVAVVPPSERELKTRKFTRTVTPDPNEEYLRIVSPSERTEYWKALVGDRPTEKIGGCAGAVSRVTMGPYDVLQKRLIEFETRLSADPRVVPLDRKWAACMKGMGYVVSKEADLVVNVLIPASQQIFQSDPAKSGGTMARSNDAEAVYNKFERKVSKAADQCSPPVAEKTRKGVRAELLKVWGEENASLLSEIAREDNKYG